MEKFQAAMLLGAVGDSLGYRKGRWEGCTSGSQIQKELAALGGLAALKLDPENWPLSDGALMHMTTAEALVTGKDARKVKLIVERKLDFQGILRNISHNYISFFTNSFTGLV